MKNKRGFLLGEETLKIIIAVISIGFLVYLLTALYFSATGAEKIKQAEASITNVVSKEIIRINNGGDYSEQGVLIPNPSDWHIFSFVGEDKKPNKCTGDNCVCICGKVLFDIFDGQIKECDKKGSCVVVSNLLKFENIQIEKQGTTIYVEKINNDIEIRK